MEIITFLPILSIHSGPGSLIVSLGTSRPQSTQHSVGHGADPPAPPEYTLLALIGCVGAAGPRAGAGSGASGRSEAPGVLSHPGDAGPAQALPGTPPPLLAGRLPSPASSAWNFPAPPLPSQGLTADSPPFTSGPASTSRAT